MTRFRLAAVGDNCVDRFLGADARALIGGNALNVAVQWARLSAQSFYFGAVGRDGRGEATRAILLDNGVDVSGLTHRDGPTAWTDIEVLPSGERVFRFEEFGVCRGYGPSEAELQTLCGMDHVHIGWLDDGGRVRRRLAEAGVSCSQDISVNNRPDHLGVDGLTYAFASAEPDAAEATAKALLDAGARTAVVSMGPEGALAMNRSGQAHAAALPIRPVDTTGAGDSLIAAFLLARLKGESLEGALGAGCRLAAATCLHPGGFPQAPLRA